MSISALQMNPQTFYERLKIKDFGYLWFFIYISCFECFHVFSGNFDLSKKTYLKCISVYIKPLVAKKNYICFIKLPFWRIFYDKYRNS